MCSEFFYIRVNYFCEDRKYFFRSVGPAAESIVESRFKYLKRLRQFCCISGAAAEIGELVVESSPPNLTFISVKTSQHFPHVLCSPFYCFRGLSSNCHVPARWRRAPQSLCRGIPFMSAEFAPPSPAFSPKTRAHSETLALNFTSASRSRQSCSLCSIFTFLASPRLVYPGKSLLHP